MLLCVQYDSCWRICIHPTLTRITLLILILPPHPHLHNKTLTDSDLWRSFQAKANEVSESAKIFVSNRVERDLKLLASIGLFAFDRIQKDVARALPASSQAASRAMNKVLQLGNSSSLEEMQTTAELREELITPLDEIKSVSQSLKEILSGEPMSAVSTSSRRGLRTAAPAGQRNTAERQRRALQRRQETTLKQEKDVLPDLGGIAGSLTDTAWELKREMEVETSRPGYRSETARTAIAEGAKKTVKAIQAAQEEPGGWKRLLLGEPKKAQAPKLLEALQSTTVVTTTDDDDNVQTEIPVDNDVASDMDESVADVPEQPRPEPGYRDIFFGSDDRTDQGMGTVNGMQQQDVVAEAAVEEATDDTSETVVIPMIDDDSIMDAVVDVVTETTTDEEDLESNVVETEVTTVTPEQSAAEMFFSTTASKPTTTDAVDDTTADESDDTDNVFVPEGSVLLPVREGDIKVLLPIELAQEQANIVERIQFCIESPEKSWLAASVITPTDFQPDAIVNAMFDCRDSLEVDNEATNAADVLSRLRAAKEKVDGVVAVAQKAGGNGVADSLGTQLYGEGVEEGVQPIMMILNEIEATIERAAEVARNPAAAVSTMNTNGTTENSLVDDSSDMPIREVEAVLVDAEVAAEKDIVVEPEIVTQDAVVTKVVSNVDTGFAGTSSVQGGNNDGSTDKGTTPAATVEIVSDSDFEKAVGEAKQAESVSGDGTSDDDGAPGGELLADDNALVQVTLRSLDVGFFVTEKVLTVRIDACLCVVCAYVCVGYPV